MTEQTDFDPFAPMTDLATRIREGDLTATAAVEGYLEEIDRRDDEINAYVTVIEESAREAAAAADDALEAGESVGPLHGVPVAIKDLRDMKEGVAHTFGSKLVADTGFVSPRTSASVQRLEDAGAIVLGKTNVPEFGHKGATDNNVIGPTASPIDPSNQAGGSSGGSAAAVAGGMAAVATGSDSGGSIRIPAAACGLFGHKPSFGIIPVDARPNAFGMKTHHTVHGPLARTVRDAALVLDVTKGYHPDDPSSVPVDIDFLDAVDRPVDDLRIAYSADLDVFPIADDVADTVEDALAGFEAAGATVEPISVDHGLSLETLKEDIETTFSTQLVGVAEILKAEFGVDMRDFDDLVTESLLKLLAIGDEKTVAEFAATGLTRTELFDAVQDIFAEYDLLATPTLGVSQLELETDRGLEWETALTWPFNWTGHPAAALPAGRTADDGLASIQLVGKPYRDETVIAASAAFERERPWESLYPR